MSQSERELERITILREKLRRLEREIDNPFADQETCCGLTLAQCHTLLEVGKAGEISLVDLAGTLNLDTSTLSRTVQGLVLIGLVSRVPNEKDRRFVVLSLTEQGRKTFASIENLFNEFFQGVMEFVPEERRDRVVEDVGLLADAVRSYNEKTGCCGRRKRR
ncbi:MAG: winged helix-turn-helix transcriptional regulator [Candidatus Aminicenantes bacterium]|nr:winged helix-turn-helix transcriptional regulator [Candidatus Aminicenantes bacterium]